MIEISKILKEIQTGTVVSEVEPGIFHATSASSEYVIIYDKNACIGAASCAAIAPLTFFMNEENKADLVSSDGADPSNINILEDGSLHSTQNSFDTDEVILESAMSCPVLAIQVFNKKTGEKIFPVE